MGHTHIITILEDALVSHLRRDAQTRDDLCRELGQKIIILCENRGIPSAAPCDQASDSLGDWMGAVAWHGYPDTAQDMLFYWGADLMPIEEITDQQLALAEKLLNREKARRTAT